MDAPALNPINLSDAVLNGGALRDTVPPRRSKVLIAARPVLNLEYPLAAVF